MCHSRDQTRCRRNRGGRDRVQWPQPCMRGSICISVRNQSPPRGSSAICLAGRGPNGRASLYCLRSGLRSRSADRNHRCTARLFSSCSVVRTVATLVAASVAAAAEAAAAAAAAAEAAAAEAAAAMPVVAVTAALMAAARRAKAEAVDEGMRCPCRRTACYVSTPACCWNARSRQFSSDPLCNI